MEILCFGIACDLTGHRKVSLNHEGIQNVADLRRVLNETYPNLARLAVYMIAVNENYAQDSDVVKADDEIAIIPPVSGG